MVGEFWASARGGSFRRRLGIEDVLFRAPGSWEMSSFDCTSLKMIVTDCVGIAQDHGPESGVCRGYQEGDEAGNYKDDKGARQGHLNAFWM